MYYVWQLFFGGIAMLLRQQGISVVRVGGWWL